MSYNIDSVEYLTDSKLRINKNIYAKLARSIKLPELCFLDDEDCVTQASEAKDELVIDKPWWSASWSGNSFDDLKTKVLPKTKGSADLLFTWEGGDSHSGLRVVDGKVTECEVVFALKERT